MPRLRTAERALTLLASSPTTPSQTYICRTCRLHAVRRTLHTSPPLLADQSWLKRIQQSVFGSKESKDAERKREEARKTRVEELSNQPEEERAVRIVRDRKGGEYEIAAVVDQSLDKGYVPATTWAGLEKVGGEEWVRRRADGGERYLGFATTTQIKLSHDEWKSLLHHVAVEVLALRQAGRNVDQVCYQRATTKSARRTKHISIAADGDGVTLTPAEETSIENVLESIPETAQEASQATAQVLVHEAEEAAGRGKNQKPATRQENDDWMQLPLSDPAIKLTILKRTTQLTGHRPRDATISSVRTLADLYDAFKTPEKPKKLHQSGKMHALKRENPNVTVHSSRRTSIDKHREVGRWKVIAEELEQRGLPVTGSRWKDAKTQVGVEGEKKKKKKTKGARRHAS